MFTHDDRLPEAFRGLRLGATILQVNRREMSQVEIVSVSDPAQRYLDDAHALVKDSHVGPAVAGKVVPGLCRMALDATCVSIIKSKRLSAGTTHQDLDRLLDEHPKLYVRMALALFDPDCAGDVMTRLNRSARGRPTHSSPSTPERTLARMPTSTSS